MARLPRLYAPDVPQLAQVSFARPLAPLSDPTPASALNQLAGWLREAAHDHRVAVHGWALLNDRLVLLATPAGPEGIARQIQAVGRRYAAASRQGRVFTERYRSALLQPGLWVLPALVWLDLLPVRLGYVDQPERWPWSSAAHHVGVAAPATDWLSPHRDYWQEGNTPYERQAHYRARLSQDLAPTDQRQIEATLFGQWALGDPPFLAALERQANRRPTPAPRGRPRKAAPVPPGTSV